MKNYCFCNSLRSFASGARHGILVTTSIGMVSFVLNQCPSSVLECVCNVQVAIKYLVLLSYCENL